MTLPYHFKSIKCLRCEETNFQEEQDEMLHTEIFICHSCGEYFISKNENIFPSKVKAPEPFYFSDPSACYKKNEWHFFQFDKKNDG